MGNESAPDSSYNTRDTQEHDGKNDESMVISKPPKMGVRHLQAALLFLSMAIVFGFRISLSVSMVAMTRNTTNSDYLIFDWSKATQGLIFSSNFWGLMPSYILGAMIVQRFGGKLPLVVSVFGISFLTMFTPLLAISGAAFMCAKQAFDGILVGLVFPSVFNILGKWVHPKERDFLAPITMSGIVVGSMYALIISGFIAASPLGWPGTFYVPGATGVLFSIILMKYGKNEPTHCSQLSKQELEFLSTIPGRTLQRQDTPWKIMLRSKPVWAQIIAQFGHNWGTIFLLIVMPTYIESILGFDIKTNGMLSAVPYLLRLIVTISVSYVSKYIIKHKLVSTLSARKLFTTLGMSVPAFSLIWLSFITINTFGAIALFSLAIGFVGAANAGFMTSVLDFAPNFSAAIAGLCNFVATIASIVVPMVFGFIVNDTHDLYLWRIVFLLTAAIFILSNLMYVICIECKIQDWNSNQEQEASIKHLS